ncbi:excisionase family DNA binding protein [Leeuwenhoekiella aestuarii]|uniref:Excisionase family DNA binding protein n=1 Tax=Leeuwenhoekiella aestuarii TaxID=2249426 RepID=A0A4Q0NVM0_9FLAO|nr:helix-turn-helix domain-containing protein [Leeuwenhoekiella aestuarii]RXG14294.1 excisionase family DNA binding protein [Leeuwenhoekiella aestuarii]RXG19043.1 excisionase family DNA binding protein [Leeuwenhoekiella aestuarii]
MDLLRILEKLDRIEQLLIADKRVLNFDEACDFTGISKSFMYKLTSSRQIPHCKPNGKLIYFEREKLEKWLLQNYKQSNAELEEEALKLSFRKRRFL